MTEFDAKAFIDRLGGDRPVEVHGRVRSAVGLVVRAALPEAWVGELCEISRPRRREAVAAEVVGFRGEEALLMPLGDLAEIGTTSVVRRLGRPLTVGVGPELLGRVLDGLGRPADGRPLPDGLDRAPLDRRPPDPLDRPPVVEALRTRVRAIDGLLTVGVGQRVGLFAGAGVGKSTLLGMIARNVRADVTVIGLVGERGREVREFLECDLGEEARSSAVTIVATSDQPSLVRLKAAYTATAVAEHFRDRGARVLLLVDSVTRFARARREVGLAAGEPPARAGFPPSVFAELPKLLERAGTAACGSITAFYTVLVEGDDHNEPVADEARSILDGHVVLSAGRAAAGIFPAVDVGASVSRVMSRVAGPGHVAAARRVRSLLATYERERDMLLAGAYEPGADPRVDEAAAKIDDIEAFLRQEPYEVSDFETTRAQLDFLAAAYQAPPDDELAGEDLFGEGYYGEGER